MRFKSWIFAMALIMIAACEYEGWFYDEPEKSPDIEHIAVKNLKAEIITRAEATIELWEDTYEFGLYMKKAGHALTIGGAVFTDAANVQMIVIDNDIISSTGQLYYPMEGNVDLIAYYPYTASVVGDFTIPINIAEQANGLPVEVLYSNNIVNQAATTSQVTLEFNYVLAKIELTVTNEVNSKLSESDFAAMTVTVEGLCTQANMQLANGTLSDISPKQSVMLHRKSSNATSATFEMLALPSSEEITFLFNVGNEVYRYETTAVYESAKLYRYQFELNFLDKSIDDVYLLTEYFWSEDNDWDNAGGYMFEYDEQNRIKKMTRISWGEVAYVYTPTYNNVGDMVSVYIEDFRNLEYNRTLTFIKNGNLITYTDRIWEENIELNEEGLPISCFGSDDSGIRYFYWQDGNMTHYYSEEYNDNNELSISSANFKYDDKKNPMTYCKTPKWYLAFFIGDGLMFANKNNIIDSGEGVNLIYTYNEAGFPVSAEEEGGMSSSIFKYEQR